MDHRVPRRVTFPILHPRDKEELGLPRHLQVRGHTAAGTPWPRRVDCACLPTSCLSVSFAMGKHQLASPWGQ